jgi:hypothetical protein
MAYSDYLIRVGNYTIPTSFMQYKTYKTKLAVVDVDSYRDADVVAHRFASEHVLNKVEFSTIYLFDDRMDELMANIRGSYIVAKERKLSATMWVPELGRHMTQEMYLADPEFTVYTLGNGKILYMPTKFSFTAY